MDSDKYMPIFQQNIFVATIYATSLVSLKTRANSALSKSHLPQSVRGRHAINQGANQTASLNLVYLASVTRPACWIQQCLVSFNMV